MRTRSASPNFNDVKYNVNCDVNCVMSCVSLSDVRSTSRVSVCSVPSFIIVQVCLIEVGSPCRGSSLLSRLESVRDGEVPPQKELSSYVE